EEAGVSAREGTPAAWKTSEDAATTALPTAVAGAEAREGDRSGDDAFAVGEVGLPGGVDGPDGGDQPEGCVRRAGTAAEQEPAFLGKPVLLACITGTTGRDDVVPGVLAAAGPGHHVVDVLGAMAAVLAPVTVAGEDGST